MGEGASAGGGGGEGPAPGEAERMDAGMQAGRAGGREAHMCERETVMSAFPSGLVTWPLPGKQTGNRLHKGRAGWGRAEAMPLTLSSLQRPKPAGFQAGDKVVSKWNCLWPSQGIGLRGGKLFAFITSSRGLETF